MADGRIGALAIALALVGLAPASAQQACTRAGVEVRCNDGVTGIFTGDAIVWPDGTQSRAAAVNPSVVIGNRNSVVIGPGVVTGSPSGKGSVPMQDPTRTRCVLLDGVKYCN